MLRVRLLGELQADVDGAAVAPPRESPRVGLLAWLALHPGEHARGAVAARFWPDVLDSSARASLRSALWALRRALGDDEALIAGRDRIALRCETDLADFDAHWRRAGWRRPSRCTAGRCSPTSTTTGCWRRATSTPSGSGRRWRGSPRRRPPGGRRRLGPPPARARPARRGGRPRPDAPPRRRRRPRRGARHLRPPLRPPARRARPRAVGRDARAGRHVRATEQAPRRAGAPATAVGRRPARSIGRDARRSPRSTGRCGQRCEAGAGGGGRASAARPGSGRRGWRRAARPRPRGQRARRPLHRRRPRRCAAVRPVGRAAGRAGARARAAARRRQLAGGARAAGAVAAARLGRAAVEPADVPPELARARLFEAAVELAEHATADRPLVLLFDDVHLADAPTLELAAYLARRIERAAACCSCSRGA